MDGGGTGTTALVGLAGRSPRGRGRAGPSNPQAAGFEAAADAIAEAVRAALADAGRGDEPVESAVLGIAGGGRADDQARLGALVAARLGVPGARVQVVPDLALVLPAAGLASGVGVIAGTGSSVFAIDPDGRVARAGGWGYLIDDDGSGFDVGREALRAVVRAWDGLARPTSLAEAVFAHLGVVDPRGVVGAVYGAPSPKSVIADLAPLVVSTATEGDPAARAIVQRAGRHLARLANAAATRLALDAAAPVVGAGSLFRAGSVLLRPLRAELARLGRRGVFRLLDRPPAEGALRLATGEVVLPPLGP